MQNKQIDEIADRTIARVIDHFDKTPDADPKTYIKRGIRFACEDIKTINTDPQGKQSYDKETAGNR